MDFLSRSNGGIFEAERRLQQSVAELPEIELQVVGLEDRWTAADQNLWKPLSPVACGVLGPQSFGFAPSLLPTLDGSGADLAYCVGLWKYPSMAVHRWSVQKRIPCVIAPHGMLDRWALKNSALKKRLAGWLFQNAHLKQAACLRALCEAEKQALRDYGLTNPIAVIPNGIDLPQANLSNGSESPIFPSNRKILLYLGRLHPKKGLKNLLRAWALLMQESPSASEEWVLALAGWDQGGHEAELKKLATELRLSSASLGDNVSAQSASVIFAGPLFGEAKCLAYRQCAGFILPSMSEGLPMVVLEAWSYEKPVLITAECNLPEAFQAGAALRIQQDSAPMAAVIGEFSTMKHEERCLMGGRGLQLVQERFAWGKVAPQLIAVYRWILGTGGRPDCVAVD